MVRQTKTTTLNPNVMIIVCFFFGLLGAYVYTTHKQRATSDLHTAIGDSSLNPSRLQPVQVINVLPEDHSYREPAFPRRAASYLGGLRTRPTLEYHQIGFLFNERMQLTLPLYGRRTYASSIMWNYYTLSDQLQTIPISLERDGRDCVKDIGCKELDSGDTVKVVGFGEPFEVKLY